MCALYYWIPNRACQVVGGAMSLFASVSCSSSLLHVMLSPLWSVSFPIGCATLYRFSSFFLGIPPFLSSPRNAPISRSMDSSLPPSFPAFRFRLARRPSQPLLAITVIRCIRQASSMHPSWASSSFHLSLSTFNSLRTHGPFQGRVSTLVTVCIFLFAVPMLPSEVTSCTTHPSPQPLLMKRSCSSRQNGTPCSRFSLFLSG